MGWEDAPAADSCLPMGFSTWLLWLLTEAAPAEPQTRPLLLILVLFRC